MKCLIDFKTEKEVSLKISSKSTEKLLKAGKNHANHYTLPVFGKIEK